MSITLSFSSYDSLILFVGIQCFNWTNNVDPPEIIPSFFHFPFPHRVSFDEIVKVLVTLMDMSERREYHSLTEEYEEMEKLLLNAEFASKRNTAADEDTSDSNLIPPGYHRVVSADHK